MDIDIAVESTYPIPFINSTLLPIFLLSLARQKHTPNTAKTILQEYDYIIVGAGSAGSVVAGRLSEVPCVSVLLLEAGKPPPLLTEVPGLARAFWFTDIDWQYRTAPQKYAGDALVNRQVVWPSGKTLGGSSVLNGMLYVRGNRHNYDNWAAEGAEGWSYKDVLPYFKKLEDNRDPEYVSNGYHGVNGPMTMHRPRYQPEIKDPIFEGVRYLGYKVVDSNGHRQTGYYDQQATLRAGQRCSTAKAYLVPAENRANLHILPNAMVRKVIIKNRRAVGVEFDFQNVTFVVRARKEVIMSAGTVNTAQLLMLSGIGPRKELKRFKIPLIADLPVGKNMQDHCGSNVNFELSPNIPPFSAKAIDPANIEQYMQNRTGPLASSEIVAALAFLKDDNINPKEDFPNHQLYFGETVAEIGLQFGVTPQTYAQLYAPLEGKPFYTCISHLLQPRSRGTVTLRSTDPYVPPVIDPNYYEDPDDLQDVVEVGALIQNFPKCKRSRGTVTLRSTDPYVPPVIDPNYYEDPDDLQDVVEGLKNCVRLGTSPPMRRVGSVLSQRLVPGCEKYVNDEDRYFWCQAKSIVFTLNHQVGTARMGDPNDPRTVVDPQLRVKSIEGLRVVDASVMPTIPSGNTGVPTIMVAEKASDIIKATITCHAKPTDENAWKEAEADEWESDIALSDYHNPLLDDQ